MEDLILQVAAALITALLGYIGMWVRARFGVEISAKHRDALHSALMTGVETAVRRNPAAGVREVMDDAIEYARESVPDALKALAPSNPILRTIAERYANKAFDRLQQATALQEQAAESHARRLGGYDQAGAAK